MSVIKDMYLNYVNTASNLKGFKVGTKEEVNYDITYLADGFCDAVDNNDSVKQNQFISALFVRYWYMIPYIYEKAKGYGFEIEDMTSWLYEGFDKAFKTRGWKNKNMSVSKDEKGAEKCINQCITSVIQSHFKFMYTQKRRQSLVTYSLDAMLEGDFDAEHSPLMACSDESIQNYSCDSLIEDYVKKGKLFDAVILNAICFDDVFIPYFSHSKLSHAIRHMTTQEMHEFVEKYNANPEEFYRYLNKVQTYSRTHLSQLIDESLNRLSKDKAVRAFMN